MTYFTFLAIFTGIPIALLSGMTIYDYQRGKWLPSALSAWRAWVVLLGLCIVAFIYTTPWDNYLVATRVWWYNPDLVTGIVFGYVPIEEYTFFLVLPVLSGLWLLLLARYLPVNPKPANSLKIRAYATVVSAGVWLVSVFLLLLSFIQPAIFKPFTYLSLTLSWALIPITIQMAFGADILWRHRTKVFLAITTSTLYLSAADTIAISAGTWTIDPAQSLPIFLGGILPIEEFVFFLVVNTLVVMGMVLVLAEESQPRAIALERYAVLRPLIQRIKPQIVSEAS